MLTKMIMLSGGSSVGKTSVLKHLVPYLKKQNKTIMLCKIDCIQTTEQEVYRDLKVPYVVSVSGDICPDHFLVSNLPELWNYAEQNNCEYLIIETAGLCHRCSPATVQSVAGCILDCTASAKSPSQLGPMLTNADFIVPTKIDMVSQAEQEIILWNLKQLNPGAALFPVDGLAGYGAELLGDFLVSLHDIETYENDTLRHTMPSCVCSYCVGERRVGSAFQQGVVGKINFEEAGL
ncbi:MAG: GTP-binding protein [Lachnospiraceae bacterium]